MPYANLHFYLNMQHFYMIVTECSNYWCVVSVSIHPPYCQGVAPNTYLTMRCV